MNAEAVRQVAAEDVKELAQTLAKAFIDDPGLAWMVSDQEARRRILPGFFQAIVGGSQRNGVALSTNDNTAATLWRLPGQPGPGMLESLMFLPKMLPLLRLARTRAMVMNKAVSAHWPAFPFRYLQFAGVHPDHQGSGRGGAVIRAGLELAEQAGDPVYLETPKPSNVDLYCRLGFAVVDEWEVEGSSLHFFSMLKAP